MITIDVERVGDHTDSAHITIPPGELVKLTLMYHAEVLADFTDAELAAELARRLEAR